jgi:hypothetical protein
VDGSELPEMIKSVEVNVPVRPTIGIAWLALAVREIPNKNKIANAEIFKIRGAEL